MPTAQEEFWRGSFGDSYRERCRVNWRSRIPFWRDIIDKTQAGSIMEVGCGSGWNLRAIREIDPTITLWGVDVNQSAINEAWDADLKVVNFAASDVAELGQFDLTLTVGVLIHIPPEQLTEVMEAIISASRRYVLAVEYAADEETEVNYRGHAERLWKRPFGKLYEDLGLAMVHEGEAPTPAFDRCHAWLLRL